MTDSLRPLWTVARQAPLSMEFFRQECCTGLPCLPPGDLPNPGIEPSSPTLRADSLLSAIREAQEYWSGLPCLPPGDLPDPGIEPVSPSLAGSFFTELPGKPHQPDEPTKFPLVSRFSSWWPWLPVSCPLDLPLLSLSGLLHIHLVSIYLCKKYLLIAYSDGFKTWPQIL